MVESDERNDAFEREIYFPVCFAKDLDLIRLPYVERDEENQGRKHDSSNERAKYIHKRKFCFLQFFDILHREDLKVDTIDVITNSVGIRWHKTKGMNRIAQGGNLDWFL